jgi:hypothetical protein
MKDFLSNTCHQYHVFCFFFSFLSAVALFFYKRRFPRNGIKSRTGKTGADDNKTNNVFKNTVNPV